MVSPLHHTSLSFNALNCYVATDTIFAWFPLSTLPCLETWKSIFCLLHLVMIKIIVAFPKGCCFMDCEYSQELSNHIRRLHCAASQFLASLFPFNLCLAPCFCFSSEISWYANGEHAFSVEPQKIFTFCLINVEILLLRIELVDYISDWYWMFLQFCYNSVCQKSSLVLLLAWFSYGSFLCIRVIILCVF